MKKHLLIATLAMTASVSLYAQAPKEYAGEAFSALSPNGQYAISSSYESTAIRNLTTGEVYSYTESYYAGNGNVASNTGVVVGMTMAPMAQYWKDGEWHDLPSVADRLMSKADGITPDGSRIVGSVSPETYGGDYEGMMLVPCYWDMQADGTPGELHMLPFPEKDFAGRTPQYITALRVSDDGKIIAGQVQDYSGFVCQPIVYRQDNNGDWTYALIHDELYHPEGFVLPEDPGEGPSTQPEAYMTPDELAAYEQALAAYEQAMDEWYAEGTWDYDTMPVYPDAADYMGDASKAAFEAALAAAEEWDAKWTEYSEAFQELCEMVPGFTFNNVLMSGDGKLYASTAQSGDFFTGYSYVPYVYNLNDDTYTAYTDNEESLIVSSMANNGTLLAQVPQSFTNPAAQAYIMPAGTDKFVPLYDYFTTANPSLAEWMKDNMTHEYTMYDWYYDEDLDDYVETSTTEEVLATGIPFTNADMTIIATAVENFWFDWANGDPDTYVDVYGYILPLNYVSTDIATMDATKAHAVVKGMVGGTLAFTGEVASATVYDMAGNMVYAVKAPESTVATGLNKGIYVVKMVAADGTTTTTKVAL